MFPNTCIRAWLFSYLTESYTWANLHLMLIVPVPLILPGAVPKDRKLWCPLKSLMSKTEQILNQAFTDIYFLLLFSETKTDTFFKKSCVLYLLHLTSHSIKIDRLVSLSGSQCWRVQKAFLFSQTYVKITGLWILI